MNQTTREREITAVGRAALEYLADRAKQSSTVARIAEWIKVPLPKTQAALMDLRELGFVRYFPGHPGAWAVTAEGYREIDLALQSSDRYRMGLEAIVLLNGTFDSDALANARKIAKAALGR